MNVRKYNFTVATRDKIRSVGIGMNRLDALFKALQRCNLRVDALAREIVKLRIVLVIANERSVGRTVVKVHLVEVLIGDGRKLLLPVLSGCVRGDPSGHTSSDRNCGNNSSHNSFQCPGWIAMRQPVPGPGFQVTRESQAELRRDVWQPKEISAIPGA